MGTPLYTTDIIPMTSRPTLTVMDDGDYFVILDTSTGKISKILKTNIMTALKITYDNTSGLTAETVQAALDELVVNLGSSDSAILALAGRLDTLEGTGAGSVAKAIGDYAIPLVPTATEGGVAVFGSDGSVVDGGKITPEQTDFISSFGNLFNSGSYLNVNGKYITNDGVVIDQPDYGYSHKIAITAGDTYTIFTHPNYNNGGVIYDANDNVLVALNTVPYLQTFTKIAPENSSYMRINYSIATKSTSIVVVGTSIPDVFPKFLYSLFSSETPVGKFNGATIQRKNFSVLISSGKISVRMKWDETTDLYHLLSYPDTTNNLDFNMYGIYTCDNSVPLGNISGTLYKTAQDDCCPISANGAYLGGNHAVLVSLVTANLHGKQIVDIGSLWTINSINYILAEIVDANNLKFISDYTGVYSSPSVLISGTTGTLTHVSGATNTSSISFTGNTSSQLWPFKSNKTFSMVLDGKEISDDGLYSGESFKILENYSIPDVQSVQTFLKNSAGGSVPPDWEDDSIDSVVDVMNNYEFGENGSITLKTVYSFLKDTLVGVCSVTQSQGIGKWLYVPGAGVVNGLDLGTIVDSTPGVPSILHSSWLNLDNPPYRFHQWNTDFSKGMALGYNAQSYKTNSTVRKNITSAGYLSGQKIYPLAGITGVRLAGEIDEYIAFRVPLKMVDPQATDLYWYWIGNDIYLAFDYHVDVDKFIVLPGYMAGKKIEQLDIHENTTVISEIVSSKGIKVKIISGYGYGVLRLYD